MSELKATVQETKSSIGHVGFHAKDYEKIEYDFTFIDCVFNVENPDSQSCGLIKNGRDVLL